MVFAKLVNPLLCLIIILALVYLGQEILKPLAFACLVALLLISPCRFFERQGFPRGVSALISMLLASACLTMAAGETAQSDDKAIREIVLRAMFKSASGVSEGIGVFFISAEEWRSDPPDAFMSRFASNKPPVRKVSEAVKKSLAK